MYIPEHGFVLKDSPPVKPGALLKHYFEILESFAGPAAEVAKKSKASPGDVARDFVADADARRAFAVDVVPTLRRSITAFWSANHGAVHEMRTRLSGARALFGGDIGPQLADGLFSRAGLYFDTIIVHDPIIRLLRTPFRPEELPYYVLKYGVTQLLQKDVYLADFWPPIALLVPDRNLFEDSKDNEQLIKIAGIDALLLLNRLFERNFDDLNEAQAFFGKFSDAHEVFREAKRADLLVFSSDTPLEPAEQLDALLRDARRLTPLEFLPTDPKRRDLEILWRAIHGRVRQAVDLTLAADSNRASPLITAPVSFRWLRTKLDLNRELAVTALGSADDVSLQRTNALLAKPLDWLANVPLEALIDLRRRGQLSELRRLFGEALQGFSGTSVDGLSTTARNIDHRLAEAIAGHQQSVKELDAAFRSELKLAVPTFLGAVGAVFSPGIVALIPDSVRGFAGLVGATKLSGILKSLSVYLRERKKLGQTPIGILWSARKVD